MKSKLRAVAALELLLVFPGALFMAAVFLRNVQPPQYQPAHVSARIVQFYAARTHLGLWVLLMALPLLVLAAGCAALAHEWRANPAFRRAARATAIALRDHADTAVIAVATASAAGILAVVALHVLTD